MAIHDRELRKELDATLQTRKELGPEYEPELVESFLEKLEVAVDRRVRRQVAEQQVQVARGAGPARQRSGGNDFWQRFGIAALSLVLNIPLSVIASSHAGLPGLLVCWAGVVGVNAVHSTGVRALLLSRGGRRDGEWD
ncbi:hypothetical protein ACWD6P_30835 [Streptomyces sp. NPDC002446]